MVINIFNEAISLFKQSMVLPIIASAFLSVLTANIAMETKQSKFFIKITDHWIMTLFDTALHYIISFGMACVVLFIIYLFYSFF